MTKLLSVFNGCRKSHRDQRKSVSGSQIVGNGEIDACNKGKDERGFPLALLVCRLFYRSPRISERLTIQAPLIYANFEIVHTVISEDIFSEFHHRNAVSVVLMSRTGITWFCLPFSYLKDSEKEEL